MITHRFLVPEGTNEAKNVRELRALLLLIQNRKPVTNFTIFTTTDCNARCFYCYEKGRSRIPMSMKTAHDTVAYILRVSEGLNVKIRWFGGEPLSNIEVIRSICKELIENGISVSSSIVTNGLYLTDTVVEEAKRDWNVYSVQVTLDGTESVHNRIKAFTDEVENPFQQIMDSIDACLQTGISVVIRLNVNEYNVTDMLSLSEFITNRFGDRKGLRVYAAPIRNAQGKTTELDNNSVLMLNQKLLNQGLYQPGKLGKTFKLNRCMADDDGSITILPDGRIGKCEHFSESEFIGSIYDNVLDTEMIQSWKQQIDDQLECAKCPLYPQCIRLKKCEWEQFGCSEGDRQMKLQKLRSQIAAFTVK